MFVFVCVDVTFFEESQISVCKHFANLENFSRGCQDSEILVYSQNHIENRRKMSTFGT